MTQQVTIPIERLWAEARDYCEFHGLVKECGSYVSRGVANVFPTWGFYVTQWFTALGVQSKGEIVLKENRHGDWRLTYRRPRTADKNKLITNYRRAFAEATMAKDGCVAKYTNAEQTGLAQSAFDRVYRSTVEHYARYGP